VIKQVSFQASFKYTSEVAAVTLDGRLFHTCTVVTPKAWSAIIRSHVHSTISRWVEAESSRWRDSDSSVHCRSWARYRGGRFWQQRKTSWNWMHS